MSLTSAINLTSGWGHRFRYREEYIYALKGKELLNCLHEVGTLPQVFVVMELFLIYYSKLVEILNNL